MNLRSLPAAEPSAAPPSLDPSARPATPQSTSELLQELQAQQIKLELQNRALRESQAELEEAVRRYTDLYDHLPIGYVTLTRNGQILDANLTAARWLGRERAQLVGVFMNWFLDPLDGRRLAGHLELCTVVGHEQSCEVTLLLENELSLTVQLSSRMAPPARDGTVRIQTALTTLSRLKQGRRLLCDLERERQAVAGLLAPEGSQPHPAVSELALALLTEHRDCLHGEALNLAERIECAALRLEATLQHLIDYCSLGRDGVAHDPVNLEELMQQILLEHRDAIAQRGAEIEVARPLPTVRGSRLILGQVVANLLINALKHSRQPEPLRIQITADVGGGTVVLKIRDDGLRPNGEQSFRVFAQLHGAQHFLADGIGFALVRRAIEGMHGSVWVESDMHHGTCFHLQLPAI